MSKRAKKPKVTFPGDTNTGFYIIPIKHEVRRSSINWLNNLLTKVFGHKYKIDFNLGFSTSKKKRRKK